MTIITIIKITVIMIMISTTIFQNITEKLAKMAYFVFFTLGLFCLLTGKKRYYKITTDHK